MKTEKTRAARCVAGAVDNGTGAAWRTLSSYERRARAFLTGSGVRMVARLVDDAARPDWEKGAGYHCLFRVRFTSARGSMTVPAFYGSAQDWYNGRRTVGAYDVLACLQKTDPGSFDDFAADMGFFPIESAADYKRARAAWRGCCREAAGCDRVWGPASRSALWSIN